MRAFNCDEVSLVDLSRAIIDIQIIRLYFILNFF